MPVHLLLLQSLNQHFLTLLAAAINQGLIEQFDRQAEQLRQIRDDETKSIEDRIEANRRLGEVLNEQEEIMLRNADLVIAAAANELALNNNIENQVALIEARNEKLGIQAQIEGFRSEQLVNTNSLLREQQEIEQSILDGVIAAEAKKQEIRDKEEADRKKKAKEEIQLAQNVANAKVNIAGNTFALISQLVEQDSALGKGVALAQATISGFQGVQNAFTTAAANPITAVFPPFPFIQAGLAGVLSALQIKNILSVNHKKEI